MYNIDVYQKVHEYQHIKMFNLAGFNIGSPTIAFEATK